jgi:hypothetical protein
MFGLQAWEGAGPKVLPVAGLELEFVGVHVHLHDTSGGWRQPDTAAYELDSILSAEDTALLQSLVNAGSTDRVEFLA